MLDKEILKKDAIPRDLKEENEVIHSHFIKEEEGDYMNMNTPHPQYTPDYNAGGMSEYDTMMSEWGVNAQMTPIPNEAAYGPGNMGYGQIPSHMTTPQYPVATGNYYGSNSPMYRTSSPHGVQSPDRGIASPNYSPGHVGVGNPSGYIPGGGLSPNRINSPSYRPYGVGTASSPGYSPTRIYGHSSPQYSPTTPHAYPASPSYSPTTPNYQSGISPRYSSGAGTGRGMSVSPSSPIYNPTTPAYDTGNYGANVKSEVKKETKEEAKEESAPKNYQPFLPDDE